MAWRRRSQLGMMRTASYGPPFGAGGPRSRRRRWPWVAGALVVVLLAAGAVVKVRLDRESARLRAEATRVVTGFLAAWSRGDAAGAARFATPATAASAAQLLASTRTQLHATATSYRLGGPVAVDGRAGADYRASVAVAGLGTAQWIGRVPLAREGAGWGVVFAPAVVHPRLPAGGRFAYLRDSPTRGRLLAADGQSLVVDPDLTNNLRGAVGVAKAGTALPPGAVPGDEVGVNGLERAYNSQLAGTAGGSLRILDASGHPVTTLLSTRRTNGQDLRTTIDLRLQRAGEAALAGVPQAGSLVAIDTRTGALLAAVNHPASGFGRALAGKGPPGSTFKIITTTAALMAGVPTSTVLNCSPTAVINGRTFHNAENEAAGPISWQRAFAMSCNTWFVRLQEKVPIATLSAAAALYGFGTGDPATAQRLGAKALPILSFLGSYPTPRDRSQAAGQAIGQDLVLASPLGMASVAAAVASGSWRQPFVLGSAPVTHPLPPGVAATLQTFMAAVPAPGGTAAAAGLPPGTFGKTGTAETAASAANPKATDSWFAGYRGTVAFAVEFDKAGFGADVAAPAAARFLRAIG